MRVLHVVKTSDGAGWATNQAAELVRRGVEVHVAPRIRILLAVTSALAWVFYEGTIGMLRDAGYEPILVSSPGEQLHRIARDAGVRYAAIRMRREIAPLYDLLSLWRFYRVVRQARPMLTDVGTAKAGLLGGMAAWLLRVPCRIYTLHGLRLETTTGLKRILLMLTERIACACAHRVICVSPSVRQRAIELKLVSAGKTVVLGSGSCRGVDVQRFSPEIRDPAEKQCRAKSLGISPGAPVIGFVGRLTRDKGIRELILAFSQLRRKWPGLRLLLVGDFEDGDPVAPIIRQQMATDPSIVHVGWVSDTAPYYGLMDVLVLPSYREGFPYTPLEAQACGVPVVTTTATGAVDSVVDGVTGFHVPVDNWEALAAGIDQLLCDPELRARMGRRGRERVVREFRHEVVGQALVEEYERLLRGKVRTSLYQRFGKRLFDLLVTVPLLILLSPLMLIIALCSFLFMGKPLLFRQVRPGFREQPFTIYKFRTMHDLKDSQGRLLPDGQRLNRFGTFLRRTSLDELPELWNVLRGDMSLVGPRPLLMEYLPRYTPEQRRRHLVKPGITGLAQICGRQDITFSQRIELDNWYIDNYSVWLDLSVLAKTVAQVIAGSGVRTGQDVSIVDDLNAPGSSDHAHTPLDHTAS